MFVLRPPSDQRLRQILKEQGELPFTYIGVGATAGDPPTGYVVDRTRVCLGTGELVFRDAKQALRDWKHFELGWTVARPSDTPLKPGAVIGVVARTFGVWSVLPSRIVYVVNEPRRFGFAYGTLPAHAESGEERFLIEHAADDSVWYEILAFSRPWALLARLGYPMVRRLQKRFGRDSAAAMVRAVHAAHAVRS